jgi:hypothetical protein
LRHAHHQHLGGVEAIKKPHPLVRGGVGRFSP